MHSSLSTDTPVTVTALYGTFNIDGSPKTTINVTADILKYTSFKTLTIPRNTDFKRLFGDVLPAKTRYLQINVNGKIYNVAENNYSEDVVIDLHASRNTIKIVYYIYVDPKTNWRAIISGQLFQLKGYGILSEADLYIHVTDLHGKLYKITELINSITPSAIISSSFTNQFEYPGLKLVHDLALEYPDDNFLYFHSKGMSHHLHSRSWDEHILFTKTFENWRENLQLLGRNGIEKAGLFPAEEGWVWYNFWYATGKYLAQLSAPEISDHRWYYEAWLGRASPDAGIKTGNIANLYRVKHIKQVYFTPAEADFYMANLVYKMYATPQFKKTRLIIKSSFLIYCYLKIKNIFSFKRKVK